MSDTTTQALDCGIVRLDDEEGVRRVLVDTLFGLWTSINTLTRLRPSKHERLRVTAIRARHAAWTPER